MTLRHRPRGMRSARDFQPMWEQMAASHAGGASLAHQHLASLYHTRTPRIDLVEEDDAYWLYAAMPGMQPQDITVDIDDQGVLILRREHAGMACGNRDEPLARPTRALTRRFVLEEPIEHAGITTLCTDGTLAVCVPKAAQRQMAPPAVLSA